MEKPTRSLSLKECKDCGKVKELDNFHEHRMMRDGYINTCKECKQEYYIGYQIRKSNEELKAERDGEDQAS